MFERSTSDARPETSAHQCVAGTHCINGKTIEGHRIPAFTDNPETLCEPCYKRIHSAIKQLPTDWLELSRALGEKASSSGAPAVASTRTPGIPISSNKIALMSDIVEQADRAATTIAITLNTEPPTGRHNTAPPILVNGKPTKPLPDTPASSAEDAVTPDALQALRACIALVEPHVHTLAAAGPEAFIIWDRPGEETDAPLQLDEDTGQPASRHGKLFVELTGLELALDLTDTHHRVRAELGKTKLRHDYGLPCPRCGSKCGRDDGTTIVDCNNPACDGSWTEKEFKFLQGLVIEGREEDILKWLVTEAYSRLDNITTLVADLETDEATRDIEAVQLVIGALKPHLAGHQKPADRTIGTNRAATTARQIEEDNWSWRNETPYKPPKRKRAKPKPEPKQRYTASSLTTLTDIDETTIDQLRLGDQKCRQCNMIHAGECA
ncbi:MAG: hypothetical protein AB1925_12600 [Actinomycetota bacterium]